MTDIDIQRRTDRTLTITVKDNDDVAINITGYTVYFTVRETPHSSTTLIDKTVTSHLTPASGITTVTLDAATDTNIAEGSYYYQFGIRDTTDKILKTVRGKFNVYQDVNQES
jgi:hypothetical protein